MDRVVIFGAQNVYGSELFETVKRLELDVVAAVLTGIPEWSMSGITCVLQEDEVTPELAAMPAVTPNVIPSTRKEWVERARQAGFQRFSSIIDPTAVTPLSMVTGMGNYINAGAVIGSTVRLDNHAYINRAASVGHHTLVEEYGTVGPGVTIASHCVVGRGAFIGAGAVIAPSCVIGEDSVVGAGAVVIKDVPAKTVVVGNPAREIRKSAGGYRDESDQSRT